MTELRSDGLLLLASEPDLRRLPASLYYAADLISHLLSSFTETL